MASTVPVFPDRHSQKAVYPRTYSSSCGQLALWWQNLCVWYTWMAWIRNCSRNKRKYLINTFFLNCTFFYTSLYDLLYLSIVERFVWDSWSLLMFEWCETVCLETCECSPDLMIVILTWASVDRFWPPNGTNPGLFQIRFMYILSRIRLIWGQSNTEKSGKICYRHSSWICIKPKMLVLVEKSVEEIFPMWKKCWMLVSGEQSCVEQIMLTKERDWEFLWKLLVIIFKLISVIDSRLTKWPLVFYTKIKLWRCRSYAMTIIEWPIEKTDRLQ